jgi:hypothetical protein
MAKGVGQTAGCSDGHGHHAAGASEPADVVSLPPHKSPSTRCCHQPSSIHAGSRVQSPLKLSNSTVQTDTAYNPAAPSNSRAVQEAQVNLDKAREERATKDAALSTFEANSAAYEPGNDSTELSPDTQSNLNILHDAAAAVAAAEQSALASVDTASAAEVEATAAMSVKWTKTQIYWTKGLNASVAGLLAAAAAGVPVRAVILVSDPSQVPLDESTNGGDVPGAHLFHMLIQAQAAAVWNDPVLEIAAVEVTSRQSGGRLVPKDLCSGQRAGAASGEPGAPTAVGALETEAALRALATCASTYGLWRAVRRLYALKAPVSEAGTFQNLLDTVPPEQQSVPVMLHCMLEQVVCSLEGEEEAAEECAAVAAAAQLFDTAFETALAPSVLTRHHSSDAFEYRTVLEGDDVAMAACGILSGRVQSTLKRTLCIFLCCKGWYLYPYSMPDSGCHWWRCWSMGCLGVWPQLPPVVSRSARWW